MKTYQKAEMIAKNLPTGSYAAGCPTGTRINNHYFETEHGRQTGCQYCEVVS